MRFATVAACLAAAGAVAQGQEVVGLNAGRFGTIGFACAGLGIPCQLSLRFEDQFMPWLTSQAWTW